MLKTRSCKRRNGQDGIFFFPPFIFFPPFTAVHFARARWRPQCGARREGRLGEQLENTSNKCGVVQKGKKNVVNSATDTPGDYPRGGSQVPRQTWVGLKCLNVTAEHRQGRTTCCHVCKECSNARARKKKKNCWLKGGAELGQTHRASARAIKELRAEGLGYVGRVGGGGGG